MQEVDQRRVSRLCKMIAVTLLWLFSDKTYIEKLKDLDLKCCL
jgi:hypothetical protein